MAVFKCKMCGGELEVTGSVCTCKYCATQQTIPKLDDDRRANLYERANQLRRQNDFEKAEVLFETILAEDRTDAEAYWSLVLCRYGIEYVEDQLTHKRIATCNRAQYTSILADENYKQALIYADESQRRIYQQEAVVIDGIQKGILEVSAKEAPFDIFICYKEADNNGRRTQDSVLAQEIYHQLTNEGYRVFFSRITLEDKIGSAYEPYIFAALQSSRIMVVVGTRPEHINAVWVKNEWGRYIALIKGGAQKVLIPAYRDMDPYDLPKEFSHLQAQDMGKLGFMQDLVRGIKKILAPAIDENAATQSPDWSGTFNASNLLQRAFIELEYSNWQKADQLLEQVLNAEPQNAKAYLGKFMLENKIRKEEAISDSDCLPQDHPDFEKALRFSDDQFSKVLKQYNRAAEAQLDKKYDVSYQSAKQKYAQISNETGAISAAKAFEALGKYKDSAQLALDCRNIASFLRKAAIWQAGQNSSENVKADDNQNGCLSIFGVACVVVFLLMIIILIFS